MSRPAIRAALRTAAGDPGGASDDDLLARFASDRDEVAFELLVWRHAALVQRVCKAVLGDHHAAEDAAQAAFLVLARKAHTFDGRGSVVGWLYRVARRIAVRAARARRGVASAELDQVPDVRPEPGAAADEVAALCAEVGRLPERYRVPVLLCFFEGLTHADAARRTGWPVGTVAGRLARAKELLARRLSRRGVGVAAVVLGVPAGSYVGATTRAAAAFAVVPAGGAVPGVEPSVLRLAEGGLKTMTAFTWKLTAAAAALMCAVSVVTAGVFHLAARPVPPALPVAAPAPAAEPKRDAVDRVADATQRARSQNNLKQILIGLHGYHDALGHFPQNIVDKNGKPLLSWRVVVLPYMDHEDLYKQFNLEEPWDSDGNKKLLAKMPEVFRVGFEAKGETKTYYQGFAGPGALFEPGKKLSIVNFTDGTSNTIAVAEAGPPVEWTKPADIPYDPKNPPPGLDGPFSNTLIVGAGDGATYTLRRGLKEATLRRLIEIADGEVVAFDDCRAKFALTAEDLKALQKLYEENQKTVAAIADQMKEQQKLLLEIAKRPEVKGADLEEIASSSVRLKAVLMELQRVTAAMKKHLEEAPLPKK